MSGARRNDAGEDLVRGLTSREADILRQCDPASCAVRLIEEGEEGVAIRNRLVREGRMTTWDEKWPDGHVYQGWATTPRGLQAVRYAVIIACDVNPG